MGLPEHVRLIRQKIGHDPMLMPAVSMLIFNAAGEVLLGRRADTGKWAVPGGIIDPDETPAAAATREAREELGIDVSIERVSGVYASTLLVYPNQDQARYVTVAFRCTIAAGEPRVADEESLDVRFFALSGLPDDVTPSHRRRIADAAPPGRDLPAAFG